MSITFKHPATNTEYKNYYYFRWKILRKPLGGKLGEERDDREKDSVHVMLSSKKNILAIGRLHFTDKSNKGQIKFLYCTDDYNLVHTTEEM